MVTGYEPLNTLKPVSENIWIVDGPHISFYGLPFSTRMTVIRLASGELFLHSPIALTPGLKNEIDALGIVRHLISPNWIHYAYIADWQKAYSGTLAWASPKVKERAKKVQIDIRFDHDLGETAEREWGNEIEQIIVRGSDLHIEVVFFHKPSKTLILTDLIENFERSKIPVWLSVLSWLAGNLDPDGKAPIDMRWSFSRNKKALRKAIEQMIVWAPERVILAHGRWYEVNGVAEIRRAFRWA